MGRMRPWRRHAVEFKKQAVERMKTADNIEALARELGIERKLLYVWKGQFEGRPEARHANLQQSAEERKETQLRAEIQKLQGALAQRALEIDFFRDALFRIEQARQQKGVSGEKASTKPSGRGRKNKAN
jgi:transposase-like protein